MLDTDAGCVYEGTADPTRTLQQAAAAAAPAIQVVRPWATRFPVQRRACAQVGLGCTLDQGVGGLGSSSFRIHFWGPHLCGFRCLMNHLIEILGVGSITPTLVDPGK